MCFSSNTMSRFSDSSCSPHALVSLLFHCGHHGQLTPQNPHPCSLWGMWEFLVPLHDTQKELDSFSLPIYTMLEFLAVAHISLKVPRKAFVISLGSVWWHLSQLPTFWDFHSEGGVSSWHIFPLFPFFPVLPLFLWWGKW